MLHASLPQRQARLLRTMWFRASHVVARAPTAYGKTLGGFIESHCGECHDNGTAKGGLDLEVLLEVHSFELDRREVIDRWVLIRDRIRDGDAESMHQ
jgi:hypothetical protein